MRLRKLCVLCFLLAISGCEEGSHVKKPRHAPKFRVGDTVVVKAYNEKAYIIRACCLTHYDPVECSYLIRVAGRSYYGVDHFPVKISVGESELEFYKPQEEK